MKKLSRPASKRPLMFVPEELLYPGDSVLDGEGDPLEEFLDLELLSDVSKESDELFLGLLDARNFLSLD